MPLLILFFLLSFVHQIYGRVDQPQDSIGGNIVCICLPKTGTHLLLKALNSLGDASIKFDYTTRIALNKNVKKLNVHYPPNHYKGIFYLPTNGQMPQYIIKAIQDYPFVRSHWTHWQYTPEFEQFLEVNSYANFLIIRDPRDQVLSMASMVHKGYEASQVAPLETIMLDLIDGRQKNFILWGVERNGVYPVEWESGVVKFYRSYMPWINTKNMCTIYFENLVGSCGGGSQDMQLLEIKKIAKHIGKDLSQEKIALIAENLFGGSATFREGKIGSWKKYFTKEMVQAFVAAGGADLLIELGYEKNYEWIKDSGI